MQWIPLLPPRPAGLSWPLWTEWSVVWPGRHSGTFGGVARRTVWVARLGVCQQLRPRASAVGSRTASFVLGLTLTDRFSLREITATRIWPYTAGPPFRCTRMACKYIGGYLQCVYLTPSNQPDVKSKQMDEVGVAATKGTPVHWCEGWLNITRNLVSNKAKKLFSFLGGENMHNLRSRSQTNVYKMRNGRPRTCSEYFK